MARDGRSGRNGVAGGGGGRCCVGFLLKFLAFLQAFAAVSAVLYAASILSRWARHHQLHLHRLLPGLWYLLPPSLPTPFLPVYVAGWLAGSRAPSWPPACSTAPSSSQATSPPRSTADAFMMLLEAVVAGHLLLNDHWIQDLPYDHTGELENLVSFVRNNLNLCKWAALATVATQALSLFLAMVLRAMVSPTNADYDSDEDFVVIRRPLLLDQGALQPISLPRPTLEVSIRTYGAHQ